MRVSSLVSATLLPTLISSTKHASEHCKPLTNSPSWPPVSAWQKLNDSVSGHLSIPTLPAAVCHPSLPVYNTTACQTISAQWTNTSFQADSPFSAAYNDVTCLPSNSTPCSAAGYAAYAVTAHNSSDIIAAVNFARETGVRLVVKGTGHDYPGRSSGPDSLMLYTHHLRGIEVRHGDPRAVKYGGVASITIMAGEQLYGIYRAAAKAGVLVVGGADPDVGIGGWIMGGGHGPVTAVYGMGADQVLEMEVVGADGVLRTVNENCDPDLFWALRGGGAGTYAVLVSVTVKAYAQIPAVMIGYKYNTTSGSDTFWDMTAFYHSKLPSLMEHHITGYYTVVTQVEGEKNSSIGGQITGNWFGLNMTSAQLHSVLDPFHNELTSGMWKDPVYVVTNEEYLPDVTAYRVSKGPTGEKAGFSGRLGSRLLGNSSLLGDREALRAALKKTTPAPWTFLGHLVAPAPNTQHPMGMIPGGGNAILPAWRDAYTHIALPRMWGPTNHTQMLNRTNEMRDVEVQALRDLEPNSGCYMNEADPTEPNWQEAKFGVHYPALFAIKQKWDPHGVFWCKQCVGSELWNTKGEFGIENGVGQNKVELCLVEGLCQ